MLNTAAWSEIELKVLDGIHLDPRNVRLELVNAHVEADIIGDLFANENALGLVEGIAKVGYLTHEIPIVVKRRGKYVVVEGNRRLAALKAIQNPLLVPSYQARISAFAKTIPNVSALAKIHVKVAPNQELANQLIAAIHTSNLRKPWTPARQASFFQAQIDAGRSYKELLVRYPTIDVRGFVFRSRITSLFGSVSFDDNELNDYTKSKSWSRGSSTLERIYESKDFLDLTGFHLDDSGAIHHSLTPDSIKQVATTIVSGMKEGNLNTRSINTIKSPRFLQLMADLRAAIGVAEPTATDDKKGSGGGKTGTKASPSKATPKKPPPKVKQHWIIFGPIVVPESYPVALRLHYEELSVLDIQRCPNATFLLLRAILEKTIKAYAEAKGEDIKATSNDGKGYVQLSHSLKWFQEYLKKNGPKALLQPIQRVQAGNLINYTVSNDALNAINHNHNFNVDPDEVLNCWNSIDPLLRELTKP